MEAIHCGHNGMGILSKMLGRHGREKQRLYVNIYLHIIFITPLVVGRNLWGGKSRDKTNLKDTFLLLLLLGKHSKSRS